MKKCNKVFLSLVFFGMLSSCNSYSMTQPKKNVKLKIIEKSNPILKLFCKDGAQERVLEIRYLNTLRLHWDKKFTIQYTSKKLDKLKRQEDQDEAKQLVHEIARIGFNRCKDIKENLSFANWILCFFSPQNAGLVDLLDDKEKEKKRIPQEISDKFLRLVQKYT